MKAVLGEFGKEFAPDAQACLSGSAEPMPSLKAIRTRIASVKSTQKITRAMKLVAAARLRRAQDAIVGARPYANALADADRRGRAARGRRRAPAARAARARAADAWCR